ncbi:hypothetical protein [Streptomyces lavendulae]|uniref:hypothetical protein n=1 Tax=Streptomyces lavendulae TaxID=1914 RepID=UPI002555AEED|nr:hypothetical protein [Streptomyces lavendulae]
MATLTEDDVAQGRPQPMIRFEQLPAAVDAPDARGPLTAEEEETWELCQRSFAQYKDAWFVAAGALDISLRGRLWRRDYNTAEAFIRDVADMSTSNAYRQIAGARIAALLAEPPRLELESNDLSRMRDSDNVRSYVISQRAAEGLTPIREDYGDDAAADAYRTVAEATGRDKVSQRTIVGVVRQFPRKAEEELNAEQRRERLRELAVKQAAAEAAAKVQPVEPTEPVAVFAALVLAAEAFASKTDGLAAAYTAAVEADPEEAKRLAVRLRDHLTTVVDNLPNV